MTGPSQHTSRVAPKAVALLLLALTAACFTATASALAAPAGGVNLSHLSLVTTQVASGFNEPLGIVNAGDGSGRLFVVEQTGLIRVLRGGIVQPQPYLDLRSSITTADFEDGLESIIFSPTFATTGRLYAYYTAQGNYDVLERLTVSNPTTDTPALINRKVLIRQKKTTPFHHGGGMAFSPNGYLYIGMGDGGPQYGKYRHAQNHGLLLGKILRIDPGDHPGKTPFNGTYTIPKSNPFYNKKGYRKEIWALGLRNPVRLNFDSVTHDLWIGDVGQDSHEEIDFQQSGSKGGQNYGWPYWEGNHRLPSSPKTSRKGFTFPILEYPHPYGECVIGGLVYRGAASPALYGTYLYGDWAAGWIGACRRTNPTGALLAHPQVAKVAQTSAAITAFGVDEAREPYFCDWANGLLYRITATTK